MGVCIDVELSWGVHGCGTVLWVCALVWNCPVGVCIGVELSWECAMMWICPGGVHWCGTVLGCALMWNCHGGEH